MTDATSPPEPPLPRAITEMVAELHELVGVAPCVEVLGAHTWRLVLQNERVRATATYRRSPAGRLKWRSGTLTVDGQNRPIATSDAELVRTFHHPDGAPPITASPMPPPAPVEQAPPPVRQLYRTASTHVNGETQVRLGRSQRGWVIGIDSPQVALRITFSPRKNHRYEVTIKVIIDGVDYSDAVHNNLEEAFSLAASRLPRHQQPPAGQTAGPTRSNAVEVRRHSVIRN